MKSKLIFFILIVSIITSFAGTNFSTASAAESTTWTKNIEISTDTLNGVAYGADIMVAVGDNGLIRTSADGESWSYRSSPSANNLKDVAYGAGIFVACGDLGTILYSKDGIKWSAAKSITKYKLSTVIFDESKFVAVGDQGILLVSNDGIKWKALATSIKYDFWDICKCKDLYVIGGINGLYTSKDLTEWKHFKDSENYFIKTIVYDGKKIMAITRSEYENRREIGGYGSFTYVFSTENGTEWSKNELSNSFNKVIWDGKRYFAVSGLEVLVGTEIPAQIRTSNDGVNWSSISAENKAILNDVMWTGKCYIGVGYKNNILKSTDGEKWTDLSGDYLSESLGMASDGTSFVRIGVDGNVMVTKDMKSWTSSKINDKYNLHSIIWRDSKFYIWGSEKVYSSNKCLFVSKDLKKWEEFKTTSELFFSAFVDRDLDDRYFNRVIYNGNRFVRGLAWSDDGIEWDISEQEFSNGLENINDGMWDGKKYYQVGDRIISSSDGLKWKQYQLTQGDRLKGIAYSGNRYISVGSHGDYDKKKGVVYYSEDGIKWTRKALDSSALNTVLWTGKSFIASGNAGTIMESADGIKWTTHKTNTKEDFAIMSVGKDGLVAIGKEGNIFSLNRKVDFDKISKLSPNAVKKAIVPDEVLEWNVIDIGTENEFLKVIWTGKEFVAVGENGVIAFSEDGQTWDKRSIDGMGKITGVTYSDKKYVVFGKAQNGETVVAASSSDGIKWEQHTMKNICNNTGNIIWNGKMFVAMGELPIQIYSSEDGEVWNEYVTQCFSVYNKTVVWDGNRFITLGGEANISYISKDGINWAENNIWLSYGYIRDINYMNSNLIASGQGRIATSKDGSKWTFGNCPTASPIKDLIYDGKRYIAFTAGDRIIQSENLKDWEFKYSRTPFNFNSVCWNGNAYVGVGKGKIAIAYPKSFPRVLIGKKPLVFDSAPVIVNNRVLVPMRTIFDQMGAKIEWDDSKKQVTAVKGNKTVKLRIGDTVANINDSEIMLDSPAIIVNGRTMIPIRFICSSLDVEVNWSDKDKTVNIAELNK